MDARFPRQVADYPRRQKSSEHSSNSYRLPGREGWEGGRGVGGKKSRDRLELAEVPWSRQSTAFCLSCYSSIEEHSIIPNGHGATDFKSLQTYNLGQKDQITFQSHCCRQVLVENKPRYGPKGEGKLGQNRYQSIAITCSISFPYPHTPHRPHTSPTSPQMLNH